MIHNASIHRPAGHWPEDKAVGTLTLDFDARHRRRIRLATEQIIEVRHQDHHQLMRLAWHLVNRHLPTEIRDDALRIRPDHVIEDMLHRFGANLVKVEVSFQPEGGAYGGNGHDHHHGDGEHHHE